MKIRRDVVEHGSVNRNGYSYLGFKTKSWILIGTIIGVVSLLIIILVIAVNVNQDSFEEYQIIALNQHNLYRSKHQAPPLTLNKTLCKQAKVCDDHYREIKWIDHSCKEKGMNGENLYQSRGYYQDDTDGNKMDAAKMATESWYDEVSMYNWRRPRFTKGTGHFTQLVWVASSSFCISVSIQNSKAIVVALYYPHGNTQGLFSRNVLVEI